MSFENEIKRNNRKNKKVNKALVMGYAVVAALCILVMVILGAFGGKEKNLPSSSTITKSEISSVITSSETISDISSKEESSSASQSSKPQSSKPTSSKTSSIAPTSSKNTSSQSSVEAYVPNGDWRLVIANKQYPLPESYKVNVSYLDGGYRIDSRVKDSYNAMIAAAKKDGISLRLISGFRTFAGQTSLFNNKVNQYINKGYSREGKRASRTVCCASGNKRAFNRSCCRRNLSRLVQHTFIIDR